MSFKLVTINVSATLNKARYCANVKSCVCMNTTGWYVSVEKQVLTCGTTSVMPLASAFDSVVWRAT
jgi:hypothetical protein